MTWMSIYRLTDGLFLRGGVGTLPFDPATEGAATLSEAESLPIMMFERYDAASPTKRRPTTAQERADLALVQVDEQATVVSAKDKALLALCATVLEKFDASWAAMTVPQKKAAVSALATRWAFWRSWAERNL